MNKAPITNLEARGFVPTERLAWLFAVPLTLGLVSIVEDAAVPIMVVLDAAIVLIALLDGLLGGVLEGLLGRRMLVTVRRETPRFFSVGRKNTVWLHVESHARRRLRVQVRDDRSPFLGAPMKPLALTLLARQHLRVRYTLEPTKRGRHNLGSLHVRMLSPLGLFWRQSESAQVEPVRVYPDVQAVRRYELLLRRNIDSARSARRRGGESEFERLRDYTRDDDYRAIDWKATARKHRLISRELQQERNQHIVCVLECGRMMSATSGGLEQLDHALNATLMLAHVASRAGDRIGMMAFDHEVQRFLAPTGGSAAVRKVLGAGYDLHADLVEPNYERAYAILSERVRKRSLVVLFTQVHDVRAGASVLRLAKRLSRSHMVLCCLLRDRELDALAESTDPNAQYEAAAAAELVLAAEHHARDLEAQGALVLSVDPARLTPALIDYYLDIKMRQLI